MILVATHTTSGKSVQFELSGSRFYLGRSSSGDTKGKLAIDFDSKLSRRLAILTWQAGFLIVERDQSRYPLFHEGQEKDRFELFPGQRFSSGETVFELHQEMAQTLTVQMLEEAQKDSPERVLQVLLGFHPLLSTALPLTELASRATKLLAELLPAAQVGFFLMDPSGPPRPLTASPIQPSRSLVARCLEQKLPVYHIWSSAAGEGEPTRSGDEIWALAAPVLSSEDRLVLYARGRYCEEIPGHLERAALALVAQLLGQQLEGRRALDLAARVEAEARANRNLRTLLETIARCLNGESGQTFEPALLEGARKLTGAEHAAFVRDPRRKPEVDSCSGSQGSRYGIDHCSEGSTLWVAFESGNGKPEGMLCQNPPQRPFGEDQLEWLVALMGFAETLFENRALQRELVSSSQWVAAGRLAAKAVHELNTPLGAIRLSAESALAFLQRGPEPARQSMELILRSVDRCRKVTERLLASSSPRQEGRMDTFDLAPLVEDGLKDLESALQSRDVELDVELRGTCRVAGDLQDAYWAVSNLLKNAAEALSDSPPPRRLAISAEHRDGYLCLAIDDSGPGIPEELREKIFEPFFSTKRLGEGNGLGLALSRRNLRSWGGDVVLETGRLGGARFILKLPLSDP